MAGGNGWDTLAASVVAFCGEVSGVHPTEPFEASAMAVSTTFGWSLVNFGYLFKIFVIFSPDGFGVVWVYHFEILNVGCFTSNTKYVHRLICLIMDLRIQNLITSRVS